MLHQMERNGRDKMREIDGTLDTVTHTHTHTHGHSFRRQLQTN